MGTYGSPDLPPLHPPGGGLEESFLRHYELERHRSRSWTRRLLDRLHSWFTTGR